MKTINRKLELIPTIQDAVPYIIQGKTAEQDKEITEVIFRRKGWEVYALFPYEEWNRYEVASYSTLGQHSGADYHHCIRTSKPAREGDYSALKSELERIGYNLKVINKKMRRS